jgi:hypothetical protein
MYSSRVLQAFAGREWFSAMGELCFFDGAGLMGEPSQ